MKNEEKVGVLKQELLNLIYEKGVKQVFIANKCDISQSHLNNFLKRDYNLSTKKFERLNDFIKKY